ncbi:perlucin-like [Diabrotica undecimpunctata]|uniref:perlucin-like n=1 Tax=Diabrotica undecimpunctata TaxID=50387 RepID=UPI003B6372AF
MTKQIVVVLIAILFNGVMNSAESVNYVLTKDTGIAQSVAPALILERDGNTLYYFGYTFKGNWFQAMEHCKSLNMDLVSIESKPENDFLYNRMKDFFGGGAEYWFWTSGTTLPDAKWVWMRTGRPIVYANWFPNQPDNAGNNEKCMEVRYNYKNGLQWNDNNQNANLHALCEAKITKSVAEMVPEFCNLTHSVSVLR